MRRILFTNPLLVIASKTVVVPAVRHLAALDARADAPAEPLKAEPAAECFAAVRWAYHGREDRPDKL
jgi:hypothetical protein